MGVELDADLFRNHDVASIADAVRRGVVSARDVMRISLAEIERLNPALNAFVAIDPDAALIGADAIDVAISRGDDPGPLAGIPIGIKDNENAFGFVTTAGSLTQQGNVPATTDSPLVARLKAAGCVVVGKTNMPEFGLKPTTDNRIFGTSRNPWNPDRTPGGSSGGASAAIAAGMIPLATGSDGGGSIRIPSAVTGLPGFKPSPGRVPSCDTAVPGWPNLSSKGLLGRRLRDITVGLQAVRGPDRLDLRSLPGDHDDWSALATNGAPLRVAWCPTLGFAPVDDEIERICRAVVDDLADAGWPVTEIPAVFRRDPGPAIGSLVGPFMLRLADRHRGTDRWDQLDPAVIMTAELARMMTTTAMVVDAMDTSHLLGVDFAELAEDYDVVISPTTCGQTPTAELFMPAEVIIGLIQSNPELIGDIPPEVVDELVGALVGLPPINLVTGTINGVPALDWSRLTQGFNLAALPAGSSFAGLTGDGMPVGIQVAAHRLRDDHVLATMGAIERLRTSPPLPTLA